MQSAVLSTVIGPAGMSLPSNIKSVFSVHKQCYSRNMPSFLLVLALWLIIWDSMQTLMRPMLFIYPEDSTTNAHRLWKVLLYAPVRIPIFYTFYMNTKEADFHASLCPTIKQNQGKNLTSYPRLSPLRYICAAQYKVHQGLDHDITVYRSNYHQLIISLTM